MDIMSRDFAHKVTKNDSSLNKKLFNLIATRQLTIIRKNY